jgi:hypothetical protein
MTFTQSEATAGRRRFPVYLVDATDGLTAETGEAGGQPQISKNGGSWTNTSATLTAVGNGAYYVELTTGELDTLGSIAVRYKSSATAEFSRTATVIAANLHDAQRLGLAVLPSAGSIALNADGHVLSGVSSIDDIPVSVTGDGDTVALVLPTGGGFTFPASAAVLSSLTQTQVTGGAYALSTDANGRIRLVAGTGAGELDFTAGVVKANTVQVLGTAVDASPTPLDVNLVSIAGATAAVSGSGNITFTRGSTVSTLTAAQVNTEADTALSDVGLTSTVTGRIDASVSSRMATYTQPTGFLAATFPTGTVASTTNITGGTITTVTNLTNLPSIPANWLTAAGIADNAITAAKVAADADNAIADALLDRANGIETSYSLRHAMRVMLAVAAGKSSNSGGTYRDINDTKPRVTATLSDGNRTAVTVDAA